MTTQFYPRLQSTNSYRSFRRKELKFNTIEQSRKQLQPTKTDLKMLSSALICTSITLQPPITSFSRRNCRCSSFSSQPKPPRSPTRPSNLPINLNQTTSFGRNSGYVPPLPSPEDSTPQSAPPMMSPAFPNTSHPPSPLIINIPEEMAANQSPLSRSFKSFSPPTSSFGSTVTAPIPFHEDEAKPVKSPTSPCRSILRRPTGEMDERMVTAPAAASGRLETPDPISFSQSLSAMSPKGVRFDVERNSLHTYERDDKAGFSVNGVKKIRLARHLLHHKADQ